jgi:hypothetical protein
MPPGTTRPGTRLMLVPGLATSARLDAGRESLSRRNA